MLFQQCHVRPFNGRIFCMINILLASVARGCSLIITGLDGPSQVTRGSDIILHCKYDLQGDQLYAVKWFKGSREFFRFEPERSPQGIYFPTASITVDVESSSSKRLVLRDVQLATTGTYRCEVSAETTFETDYRELNLTVLDTPLGEPVIYNMQASYAVGDKVTLNCTSFESRPASSLSWLINGEPAKESYLTYYPIRWSLGSLPPLETSTLGLHFSAEEVHFRNGTLTIICTASLGRSYRKSTTARAVLAKALAPREGALATPLRPATLDKRSASGAASEWTGSNSQVYVTAAVFAMSALLFQLEAPSPL